MNPYMRAALAVVGVMVVTACARRQPLRFAHKAREITLTQSSPRDAKLGIRLLRVEPDGAAVIDVAATDEVLSAKPGEYFLGAYQPPYHVRTFGEHGLFLGKTDPSSQSAVLLHRWAETQ